MLIPSLAFYVHSPAAGHEVALARVTAIVLLAVFALSIPASLRRETEPAGAEPADSEPGAKSDSKSDSDPDSKSDSDPDVPRPRVWPFAPPSTTSTRRLRGCCARTPTSRRSTS